MKKNIACTLVTLFVSISAFATCPVIKGDYDLHQTTDKLVDGEGNKLANSAANIIFDEKINVEIYSGVTQSTLKVKSRSSEDNTEETALVNIDNQEHYSAGNEGASDFAKYSAGCQNNSIYIKDTGAAQYMNPMADGPFFKWAGKTTITVLFNNNLQVDLDTELYNVNGALVGRKVTQLIYKKN